jgi:hypothetical protein
MEFLKALRIVKSASKQTLIVTKQYMQRSMQYFNLQDTVSKLMAQLFIVLTAHVLIVQKQSSTQASRKSSSEVSTQTTGWTYFNTPLIPA